MKLITHVAMAAVGVLFFNTVGFADDVSHFRRFQGPSEEPRILALAGIREFRCDYEILPTASIRDTGGSPRYREDLELFAEVYRGTNCIGRYRMASAVNAFNDLTVPYRGIIAFGWNKEKHELVSVVDNGQFYSPWSASVVLHDFSLMDCQFFENSIPERRHSEASGDFDVYPVMGVCGDRRFKWPGGPSTDASSYLKTCQFIGAENAIIVYLYKSHFGESVPLKFDDSSSTSHFWWRTLLGIVAAVVMIGFFRYCFVRMRARSSYRDDIR